MAELSLAALVERGLAERVIGDASLTVRGIKHDSRRVEPGDLFAAVPGTQLDGARYVADAIARGAVAVIAEQAIEASVPVLTAPDMLVALCAIARCLYDDPTANLTAIGVTGTNGKTTTTYLIEAILQACGQRPAVLGTVDFRGPGGVRESTHTTPMADDMMRLAQWALQTGASHLVLEVSSHGLAMRRADGVHFKVAAFTNITRDHLDYHGDFENYARAKRRLFEELKPEVSVLNVDDSLGAALTATAHGRIVRCSRRRDATAEVKVLDWSSGPDGLRARVATPQGEGELQSPLVGEHNLENALLALGCGLALELPLSGILHGLARSQGAPGRLERVANSELGVFVDYAHTPDGLERVLQALRAVTAGRLWVIFGCGGDRDRGKRPLMGEIAGRLADVALLTSDNPRSEDPGVILAEIEAGIAATDLTRLSETELASAVRGYLTCPDRRRAIGLAVRAAHAGDSVLIAGKGHEKVQVIGARREAFDDVLEARAALDARERQR
jgi:UDP-N-acetylmuramoyl-L-alanyl-D-glutamate--2,6-diaminopimelate ligase